MSRFTFLSAAAVLSTLVVSPAQAANFTAWTSFDASTAMGTINDPNGPISVTFSASEGGVVGIFDSSTYGTFYDGSTVADVYEPDVPGTEDFIGLVADSDTAVYTLTFSQAVINPIFHVHNLDFRTYNFIGGITPTIVSGFNLAAAGSVIGDNNAASFDGGGPAKGNPNGSAYGSFQLLGTFTEISWTRPLVANAAFPTDGNSLAISASAAPSASVPEPGTLGLIGAVTMFGLGSSLKRKTASKA